MTWAVLTFPILGLAAVCLLLGSVWMLASGRARGGAMLLAACALGGLTTIGVGGWFLASLRMADDAADMGQSLSPPSNAHDMLIKLDATSEGSDRADRPVWAEQPAQQTRDGYEVSVASDPKLTPAEALADLQSKIQLSVREYATALLGGRAGEQLNVSPEFIDERIQRASYMEHVRLTVGPMYIAHAQLVFHRPVQEAFRQQHQATIVQRRMLQTGTMAGLLLTALATGFGLLKLDTATRGYYSGRLQVVGGLLILSLASAGYALVWRG